MSDSDSAARSAALNVHRLSSRPSLEWIRAMGEWGTTVGCRCYASLGYFVERWPTHSDLLADAVARPTHRPERMLYLQTKGHRGKATEEFYSLEIDRLDQYISVGIDRGVEWVLVVAVGFQRHAFAWDQQVCIKERNRQAQQFPDSDYVQIPYSARSHIFRLSTDEEDAFERIELQERERRTGVGDLFRR